MVRPWPRGVSLLAGYAVMSYLRRIFCLLTTRLGEVVGWHESENQISFMTYDKVCY